MAYYIYSRKSKFTGKGESIENQIEMCKEYIYSHIKNVTESDIIVYEDEGFSAKNLQRPMFKKMMSDSKKQKVSYIICYRLDRISRNVSDFSSLITELNDRGISFVSIKEQFDTSTPMGRAMMYIASVFAQLERETIAERIRDNMLLLARTGRWLGGTAPTGFKSEKIEETLIDGKTKQMFKLELIKKEIDIIKLIYNKFLETNSLTKTETYLIQNNIKTKNNRYFTRFSIKSILENPVYMVADKTAYNFFIEHGAELTQEHTFDGKYGVMAYNKTLQKEGKHTHIRDIKDWVIAVGKHLGIISSDNWIKVYERLEQNSSKSYRKPKSNVALLSGLLFCDSCGSYMRPKLSKRKNSAGEYIYSYICELKERSRLNNCKTKNPNGNVLDKTVCEEIKKLSFNNSEFIKSLELAQNEIISNTEKHETELKRLQNSISKIEKEISLLVDSLTSVDNTPAHKYITNKINNLHQEKIDIESRLQKLENLLQDKNLSQVEFDIIKRNVLSFGDTFDKMSIDQKRTALKSFIEKIIWDGNNINIYLFGSPKKKSDKAVILETQGEDSKFYTNVADTNFNNKSNWHEIFKVNNNLFMMGKNSFGKIIYSSLYVHKFNFFTPYKLLESELINIKYQDPKNIPTTSEKLRYYRHKKGLLQIEVARLIGVNQCTYISYENNNRSYYPVQKLSEIANIFDIEIIDLLDEYNLFLYKGQGVQIRKMRKEINLTQSGLAKELGIGTKTVQKWELNKVTISKNTLLKLLEIYEKSKLIK